MSQAKETILVTGGAGYIGSHTVLALLRAGYRVVVLDNLEYGHRELVEDVLKVELVVGDIRCRTTLDQLFATHKFAAVMHLAAYIAVGESVETPAKYYQNNVAGTLNLLEAMVAANVKNIIFASTCSIYGLPKQVPMTEDHPQDPINPYATTKWVVERMLADFDRAYDVRSVVFRFFNAAGADPGGLLGEDHYPETHLIPLVILTALGQRESISIFGTDYPTTDGTCLRDYIHVGDLANAYLLGLKYLLQGGKSEVFNLGNGNGFSVREVIETAKAITRQDIKVVECDRRPGDPPVLVGSSDKARNTLGWHPQYPALSDILSHAWQWHKKRHGKTSQLEAEPLHSNF
ncbi:MULTISPECIES: UDP-glucose 4-epimerase GalE [unclassified Coleofasciculus]|uniref:UDP-glucose 4-epimerase GalE n=1 Tax=unclassified Coleofasciculus TaxID=2692782 RepID=UPI00187FFED4|nr:MULTISPECIES: UDP-glucose 4-epimerase GalE [unclassified Coleofasciculus]MBE9125781.1 UDP-glucose 4-epimerase GalE [Coleofasciculus sp. LEGE 07081]MBE9148454.1 UDP-glucose 4-epimerase GalE [Coleofasciculus sp. LEGE 07092]